MNQRWVRNSFIYLLILVAVVAVFYTLLRPSSSGTDVTITALINKISAEQGAIKEVVVDGDNVTLETLSGEKFKARKEKDVSVFELLERANIPISGESAVPVKVKQSSSLSSIFRVLINFLPLIFIGAIVIFMMRQAQGSNNQAMSFGKSRAKMFIGNRTTVTFSDVAGVTEAKEELQEIVEFLKYPERFSTLGARIPRGVLLVGPPGTGKTLLARAVAGEAGVPFFHISGSEFVEMFVGVGASRVRDLFDQAKRNAPCIIFIDEIDAVGRHRGAGLGGGHDEREQTLNQILVEMDGFDSSINIIIVAATNRPDILDPALLRPGRFDRRVVLDAPDIAGRKAILNVHIKGKPLDEEVDLDTIAKQTPGFSGADLANLVNEGAILAARRNKTLIGTAELEEAADRVIAGPERKSRIINRHEKEVTAYHEAGHALAAHNLEFADPVHKISIVSRGNMGGYTRLLPPEDRFLYSRNQFLDMLAVALGGRTAEQIVFGDVTTGASNDLESATKIARKMITEYGMSDRLGPRTFGHKQELVFLGKEISEQRDYSDKVAEEIDEEIRALVENARERVHDILTAHRGKLNQLAQKLMADETIEGKELDELFASELPSPNGEVPEQQVEGAQVP